MGEGYPSDAGGRADERLGTAVKAVFCFRIRDNFSFRTFLS